MQDIGYSRVIIVKQQNIINKMKNLSRLLIAILLFSVTAVFTSCLDDSNDDSIPEETYKSYLSSMAGNYSGKATFYVPSASSTTSAMVAYDSIQSISWRMRTDSTILVPSFPINKLDSAINITSSTPEKYSLLKDAISEMSSTSLTAFYYIPSSSYVSSSQIQFVVNPYTLETTLNYDGADHKVYFVFYTYTFGGTWTTSRTMGMNMYLTAIYLDGTTSGDAIPSDYFNPIGIYFEGSGY